MRYRDLGMASNGGPELPFLPLFAVLRDHVLPAFSGMGQLFHDKELDYLFKGGTEPPTAHWEVEVP